MHDPQTDAQHGQPPSGLTCPECGRESMTRIYSRAKGAYFWHCENPECDVWRPDHDGKPGVPAEREAAEDVTCWRCGSTEVERVQSARTGEYLQCKACRETWDEGAPLCPDDPSHGPMRRRSGRNGEFFGCRRYPECVATRDITESIRVEEIDAEHIDLPTTAAAEGES